MKVGDHIELLRSKEKGIVTRIINSKIAEIETEDGFILPVNRDDLVVLSSHESDTPSSEAGEDKPEPFVIDPKAIVEHIYDNMDRRAEMKGKQQYNIPAPEDEIDLHIEKLTDNYADMSNGEMINLQLQVFETKLDQAIAAGKHDITFIHGVGAGVLRQAIHRVLNQLLREKRIRSFQDGRPFSSIVGCTYVKI